MTKRIEQLKRAVERACLCRAEHLRSDAVVEHYKDKIVWQGVVETFSLNQHERAKCCYAFVFADTDGAQTIKTMMGVLPVVTPQMAVKVAIVERDGRSGR